MDIRKIKKLIELLKTTGISELEIHEGEESVRISNNPNQNQTDVEHYSLPQKTPLVEEEHLNVSRETAKTLNKGHTVKSPMVGTIFLAPSPGAKPFVEIGQRVKIGDTLCMIEAMKMFNKVEADVAGVLSACLVENAHPTEYDQPLFVIEEN